LPSRARPGEPSRRSVQCAIRANKPARWLVRGAASQGCKYCCVLFVGVFGHGDEHRISSRLAALGAVPCHPGTPPSWDVANPSIVVFTGECTPKSVHLTVATDPDFAVDATIGTTSQEIDALWDDRLVPFESNLRLGRRARGDRPPSSSIQTRHGWNRRAA
jgi:hypothetical protein